MMTFCYLLIFALVASMLSLAFIRLMKDITRDGAAFGGISLRTWRRFGMTGLAVLIFGVVSASTVHALPQFLATTPVAGNGRGDTLANRPACINSYRGRTFMIYNNDGTKTDTPFEVCRYTSSGGLVWTDLTMSNQ